MLINLTNHPSALWDTTQLAAAQQQFGNVVDLPFPDVAPAGDEQYISDLADLYLDKILSLTQDAQATVHLMGEMTFTVALLNRLRTHNIPSIASTTQRIVETLPNGDKKVTFQFNKFRHYE